MHWRAPAFLIWASALTPIPRRFICDFISIALRHVYSSQAVLVLVNIACLVSYKRRESSRTHVLPRDSGLRPFSLGSSCLMPVDALPTMTPV